MSLNINEILSLASKFEKDASFSELDPALKPANEYSSTSDIIKRRMEELILNKEYISNSVTLPDETKVDLIKHLNRIINDMHNSIKEEEIYGEQPELEASMKIAKMLSLALKNK